MNKTIDHFRRMRLCSSLDDENRLIENTSRDLINKLSDTNVEEKIRELDYEWIIDKVMSRLKGMEQSIFKLYFLEQHKPKVIASTMNITVDNFYVIKGRLVKKLKLILENENNN